MSFLQFQNNDHEKIICHQQLIQDFERQKTSHNFAWKYEIKKRCYPHELEFNSHSFPCLLASPFSFPNDFKRPFEDAFLWNVCLLLFVCFFFFKIIAFVLSITSSTSVKTTIFKVLRKVRATHHYAAEDTDELTFDAGEIIAVLESREEDFLDDGWLLGVKQSDGARGVFPANFTKPLWIYIVWGRRNRPAISSEKWRRSFARRGLSWLAWYFSFVVNFSNRLYFRSFTVHWRFLTL